MREWEGEGERGARREENHDEGEDGAGGDDSGTTGMAEEEEGDEATPEGASRRARSRGDGSELGADPATAPPAAAELSCLTVSFIRAVFIWGL